MHPLKDMDAERLYHLVEELVRNDPKFSPDSIPDETLRAILRHNPIRRIMCYLLLLIIVVGVCGGALVSYTIYQDMYTGKECLVENKLREFMLEKIIFSKRNDCRFCRNVRKVARRRNLSPAEFERKYAYTMRPVVVTDAAKNWTAINRFSFSFLKKIFRGASLEAVSDRCQFFPYRSNFETLGDVFRMPQERAERLLRADPWYVGWSNCHLGAAEILRKHYGRPYFLPNLSEASKTDWIFMGTPGYGAPLHVDNVKMASWQAQLSGRKRWTLQPPYECRLDCPNNLTVVVERGDIIALDTNYWYHQTEIIGDELSITIGTEYD